MSRTRKVLLPVEKRERIARGQQLIGVLMEFGYTQAQIGTLLEKSEMAVRYYRQGKVPMDKPALKLLESEVKRLHDRLTVITADLDIS